MGKLVDLRKGEKRAVASAFATLLGITGAHTLLETARDALFLAKLPASRLPWVYLAIALAGLGMAQLAKRRDRPLPSGRRVRVTLLVAAGITLGFWAAPASLGDALLYALYVWSGIYASWVVVELWLLLGSAFTLAQAKRVYGFVGAGGVLGAVVGAAGARALAELVVAQHLLLGGVVVLVLTALVPVTFLPRPAEAEPERRQKQTALPVRGSLRSDVALTTRDPYVKRILALVAISTVALTMVDYLFKAEVARAVPKEELGAYFAGVYVVLNGIALVVQLLFVGAVFRLAGVQRALLVLPFALLFGSLGVLFGGGLAAALALKGADGALRHSLHRTSTELLYVPVVDAVRARVKPVIELLGQRGGQALASVVILGLVALGLPNEVLAGAIFALVVGWMVVATSLHRPYLDVFRQALREGRIEQSAELPDLDLAALEALFGALNSPKDAEVIGAMDILAAQERRRLIPALILYHPSRAVVLRALELFLQEGRDDYLPIADRLLDHPDAEVRAAALRARASLEQGEAFLRERLADGSPEVRASALVALLARRWAGRDESESAGQLTSELGWEDDLQQRLAELSRDPSVAVRVALCRAIEAEPSPHFEETLLSMATGEAAVESALAQAMGAVRSPRFVPALLGMLAHREPSFFARGALQAIGEPALEALDRGLGDARLPRDVRWRIPRALSKLEPARAAPILLRHLQTAEEGVVRFRILKALASLRGEDPDLVLDAGILNEVAEETTKSVLRLIAQRRALERGAEEAPARKTPAHHLLLTMLRDKEGHAVGRLFRLLGLLYPRESFERIHRGILSASPKTRASSRELCEHVIVGRLKGAVLALTDDVADDQRIAGAASFFKPEASDFEAVLRALCGRPGALGGLAAYHATELGMTLGSVPPPAPWADDALAMGLRERRREMIEHAPAPAK